MPNLNNNFKSLIEPKSASPNTLWFNLFVVSVSRTWYENDVEIYNTAFHFISITLYYIMVYCGTKLGIRRIEIKPRGWQLYYLMFYGGNYLILCSIIYEVAKVLEKFYRA